MPIISRKLIKKTRVGRRCAATPCTRDDERMPKGSTALRLYGYAELGDTPYAVYLHPECEVGAAEKADHDLGPPPERDAPIKIHGCCGCSCHVCESGHRAGQHTIACQERLMREAHDLLPSP